jgi:hypothetical protein
MITDWWVESRKKGGWEEEFTVLRTQFSVREEVYE